MICQKTGEDCGYFTFVNQVAEEGTMRRAASDFEVVNAVGSHAEDVAREFMETSQVMCSDNICGIVAKTIATSIGREALVRIQQS